MSAITSMYPHGTWLVDTEFHPQNGVEGSMPIPVCLVARELASGQTIKVWQDDLALLKIPPFPTDANALFVAYYASAEINCFISLGWKPPVNVLDLFAEFRVHTNGLRPAQGNGLLGAMLHFGIQGIGTDQKDKMRDLILSMGPWSSSEKSLILDYCESDVDALAKLLPKMEKHIDLPRALLRGQYMCAIAQMEANGVPIDMQLLNKLKSNWTVLQERLITSIDRAFGVYEGTAFKTKKFKQYLAVAGIPWPMKESGALDLSDDTFKERSLAFPQLQPLRELRHAISQMRLNGLQVGDDGRNRCLLSPFQASTGRNQPSSNKFIFAPAVWFRGLIRPTENCGVAYVDWSQQEFGIAAALSRDANMMEAYQSGDPYLAFAKQAGAAPNDATKESHKEVREQFKACVLAQQYGMGAESLSIRINQPMERARQLIELHRNTYREFWLWSNRVLVEAQFGGRLWTNFGWQIRTGINDRSLRNFPVQAHGAEMLRIACVLLIREGIKVCAPIHDAVLIEAPLENLDSAIEKTQRLMKLASQIVLGDFELNSDVKIFRYPDRYMDERGIGMWNTVMELIDEPKY